MWDDDEFQHFLGAPKQPITIVIEMLMAEWRIDEARATTVFRYLADQAGLSSGEAALEYLNHGPIRDEI
ncbi:MAG: hypothetical protein ACRYGP_07105 [Janthinobacterium lividum]